METLHIYQYALDALHYPLLVCNRAAEILHLNTGMKELIRAQELQHARGTEHDQRLGSVHSVLAHISTDDAASIRILNKIREAVPRLHNHVSISIALRTSVVARVTVTALEYERNDGLILVSFDNISHVLDELISVKNKAEESVRIKSRFLSHLSFDVRSTVNSILGYTQLLHDELKEQLTPEQEYYLTTLQWNTSRLLDTISRVYELSQFDCDEVSLKLVPVPITTVIEETVTLLKPLAVQKHIELLVHEIPADWIVLADQTILMTVFSNIIDNAIKFTETGWITISAQLTSNGGAVECCIHDTGSGMDAETLGGIFSLERHDGAHGGNFTTHGLGLILTKRYVEAMKGTLQLQSESYAGTTVTLRFPLALGAMQQSVENRQVDQQVAPSSAKPSILLIEDDSDARALVKNFLKDQYELHTVVSAEEALTFLGQQRPDLILLDIGLGSDHSGIDLMYQIRADASCASLPIIAVTAYAMPGDRERFIGIGMDDFLGKPYKRIDLLTIIEKWLPRRR